MLVTKLHIPLSSPNLVHRTTLFDKLNQGLNRKLIFLSAPAGFGKTTALSDWIAINKIPTAWYSIDNRDNDPAEFLNYIIAAIQSIKSDFGLTSLELLVAPQKPNIETIAGLIINDTLKIDNDFLVVFDDFHLIKSSEVISIIKFFIEHSPPQMHLVISTRSDPPLPMARLRSQNQLTEIRSPDLSFSSNDISIFFNKKLRLGLSLDDIYSLESKTEGWIAGLQLVALSMQGRNDLSEFIKVFAGDNRYIMDYLIEEVLNMQTEEVKNFLLKTSLLEQVSGPLCDSVLGINNSQSILEHLDRNNMFIIPLDTERHCYRYHHLFADLLKQRLITEYKSIIEELHNNACNWYEQNKMYKFAIDHALEIKNYKKSTQLLSEMVENLWETGQHTAIMKYGELLPDDIIKNNPQFCLYYAWILITTGQIPKVEPFLSNAEKIILGKIEDSTSPNDEKQYHKLLLGKIYVAFAYLNSHFEHSDCIFDYCKLAMDNLDEDNSLWYSWAWFSYGIAFFSIGELPKSNEAFIKALEYGKKCGNIYLISTIVIRLAESEQQLGHYSSAYNRCTDLLSFLKEKGYSDITKADWTFASLYFVMGTTQFTWVEMDKAYESVKTAYNLAKDGKDVYLKIFILMFYSVLLKMHGHPEGDDRIVDLEELIKKNTIPPFLTSMYIGWKIYVLMIAGQIERAQDVITEHELTLEKEKTHSNEVAYLAYARFLVYQYKLNDAETLLSELYTLAFSGMRIERLIDIKILLALLYKFKGDLNTAVSNMVEAMEFASEENLISYFLFNADHTHDLMNEAFKIQATSKTKIPKKFVNKLQSILEKYKNQKKNKQESELSSRELETLKLIAENLTNKEIADRLFISLNTVKTHVKNILLKLEVDSRLIAVSKSKELGII